MAHKRRLSVFIASMFLSSTLLSACAVSASPDPVADVAPAQEQADFATCVVTLQQKAKAAGISQQIIDTTVANLKYVPRVIELDNQQPEFTTTFGDYFDKRVTAWRVEQGKKMLAEHKSLLAKLTKEYGVPGQYIVAFWGLETNFGSYKGSMPVLDSLATLACDPRRSDYFTGELLQALTLKQQYNFADSKMVGSWAGAMGHTQFMPTNYRKYAVDGDGDGVADLWNSTDDALTSAANFLQHLGWKADERWGREVLIPSDYSFAYLGGKHPLPLVKWRELNVKQVNGQPLSTPDMQAALYLPAGHTGPAFLGYDNFNVIMRWNRSEFYAISVGHLADRINGGAVLTRAVPKQPRLSRETVKQIQQKLNDAGFDVGKPDGILGRNSVLGLQAFQHEKGLIADGFPDVETFTALGIKL
ncbi:MULTISPECIES: lytic murein transglycosylase [Shewanella]|jgi:membrane-bound lytic murein transglycosylase B|uniref:Lytic murein transglycosylase n=2 Tax=Shewanella TaxID=22 RepID=A0ABV0FPB4_9GAMM|nr:MULTISPECIES: lytic murein transglycosylase [Shewanella]NCQ43629.1 lytic murein transglycosylase [Shewanella frigidimarina]MBB1321716.1 lytic murein transglycosylase [Shewanella sp. SR43-8]NCO70003.1 lytic murein transglycosylase [Shewanella vesiculosa]NCP35543.1 lytic murein transglycosylase [Shewanella vesiculosa]NCP68124.1 lytic murein transglycosylase [Shewanella vesiculosa]|tara:strand:- start:1314 stop:2561 length:1248 start_codon:yes stop_codon:yes gene_type:complete